MRNGVRQSRRGFLACSSAGVATAALGMPAGSAASSPSTRPRTGPVGFTSFVHPAAAIETDAFSIGAQSLIEGFVRLQGRSARLGNAADLQDNDRLLDHPTARGDLVIGDGSFTAHGVTFRGFVRVGEACGTVINATVQNATIGNASLTGFIASILGQDAARPIRIPEASLVLFGARITDQSDVAANIIPVPTSFSLFASDVDSENVLLARAYNLLYRAAARMTPFSAAAGANGNPGAGFPDVASAFGRFSVGPATLDRRGTGVIPARQASLGDLGFTIYQPLSPVPTLMTPPPDQGGLDAPPSGSAEAGARFIMPRVASPELVDRNAILIGGVELAAGVKVGPGSYLHAGDAPAISVGANTTIGQHSSLHELTFTSTHVGANCTIGDRVVLHGPLFLGDNVSVGDRTVLFGPTIADGVRIGADVLIFGPVAITGDVADGTIIVPPGNEFLIAPSHKGGTGNARKSAEMDRSWRQAQAAGRACGCGVGIMLHQCV